jgi:RimJ/RimL family protein N-acetyltransferase
MILETKRLIIEHFTYADIYMWASIEADPLVRKFVDGKCLSREEAGHYVKMSMDSYAVNGFGRFAVRSKTSKRLIGMCGFLRQDEEIDFGYRYSAETWGKGIGYEAANKVLNYGLEHLKLKKICAGVAIENIPSIKILEKLGFKFEKNFFFDQTKAARYVIGS